MLDAFVSWVYCFVLAYGMPGSFVIAVLESFIFPVPTAILIAPETALGVDPFLITVVAGTGSVIGAIIGFGLGKYLGRPVAERLFRKYIPRVEKWFEKYGMWAVLLAAFSPIPFKVFTWTAGMFDLDFRKFLIASIIGRFAQFAIAAYVGAYVGPSALWWLGIDVNSLPEISNC